MNMLVETEAEKPQVLFVYVANPLQAADSRETIFQDYDPARTLADCLGPLEGEWAVSVSGLIVPREQWSEITLKSTDCVVVAPLIMGGGGGGGGKMVLRLVALVALTYFTAGAASGLAAAGYGAGTVAVASAGMMLAGTMAINALLPPAQAQVPKSGNDYDSSPTYGIDGPKNMSTRGIPVPVVYGETWFAGNFIESYIDNVGDDQYLNLLINVGEGPIEGVSEIVINDQPMNNFVGVETFLRNGTENQDIIPYFDDVIVPVNRSVNLTNQVYVLHTVTDPVDRLRLDFVLPSGFNHLDDEDGMQPTTVQWSVEIRETGSSAWRPFTDGNAIITVSGKQMSAARRSYYSDTLVRGQGYELRMIHLQATDDPNTSNKVTLADVNQITFDDITYKHTALLGMRIKLSDQLNGLPTVRYKLKGRQVPVYDVLTGKYVETWTNNPAWITLDVLMNKRYGGGISANRIKMDYFRKWATFCNQNNLTFNGAIDQRTNLWDACAPICKVGRAQLVRAGTRFQVALVCKTSPVQLFSMATIKKGSLAIDWMPSEERANEVHVTYFDKTDTAKQKTVIVANEAARERGEEARPTELTLYGVDNVDQATREGTLAMNMQQLLQTISFEAPLEAIVCTLGDVIAVQHDMPDWGTGGFTEVGSTTTKLVIDKPVIMEFGGSYVVKVRLDKVLQGTWEAEAVVGNIVVPTGPFNVQMFERYRRLVTPGTGTDYEIQEAVIDQFGRHGLRLNTTAGIKVGDTIQLWDTNVIETRNVATFDGERMTITPTVAFSSAPRPETPWAFGLYESVVHMMTVTSIGGKSDMWKQISGIEYKDDAYDDTVIDYRPDPINTSPNMPAVIFNGFKEDRYLIGAQYTSDIEMTWSCADINYSYCEVHIKIDDESWKFMDANATLYTLINISSGTIQLKLVPVTLEGFKPNFGSVPTYEYEIVGGVPRVPPAPLNFRPGVITSDIIELLWGDLDAWSASQNVYKYEVFHAGYKDARLADAQLIAVTANDHYPHIGLERLSWHTYWLRATNTQAANSKSEFAGPLSLQVIDNDPYGLIDLTDIANDLREAIDYPKVLDDLSVIVANATTKLEEATDDQKQEVFNRIQQVGEVKAYVNETVGAIIDENSAQAIRLTTLEATTNASTQAKIDELTQVVVNGDSSLAQRIAVMQVKFADDLSAGLLVEQTARADAISAIASQVTTLNSTVGENTTSLQETMKVVDGISGQYTLRIDVNGIVSGFGLATGAGGVSEFAIMATRFKIYGPGPGGTVVKTPVFSVNTETGVAYIRNAVVGDLSSDNYISGVSGWCLKK